MSELKSTVGEVIVDIIRKHAVSHVFCVPGESFLGLLDAFHEPGSPRLIATRHEEGAGVMAEAMAKATGRPGVAMVTRGPGVAHLSIAVHTAMQDSSPLVAFVGQVPATMRDRGAFQEVDIAQLGRLLGKWGVEIREPERAAELVERAFYVAQAARPGPVLVSLPEDVGLSETTKAALRAARIPVPGPTAEDVEAAAGLLTTVESVAVIAGGGVLRSGASAILGDLALELGSPVYTAWRRFDAFPNDHPMYAGNLPWIPADLRVPLLNAQVLLAVGTRLGDFSSLGYSIPLPHQRLIQIELAAEGMSVTAAPTVPIQADCRLALERLREAVKGFGSGELRRRRVEEATRAHGAYLEATAPPGNRSNGDVDLAHAFSDLRRALPPDVVTTSDAGAFTAFLNRHFSWSQPGTFFGATSGAMGYAVPAAIGVKLAKPERPVVAFVGDGGFAMVMSELETAARLRLGGLVFVVFDNLSYGAIKRNQRERFPGRELGTDLGPIDFVQIAQAMGAAGFSVRSNAELVDAMRSALAEVRPAVIHAFTDPDQLDAWTDRSRTR